MDKRIDTKENSVNKDENVNNNPNQSNNQNNFMQNTSLNPNSNQPSHIDESVPYIINRQRRFGSST